MSSWDHISWRFVLQLYFTKICLSNTAECKVPSLCDLWAESQWFKTRLWRHYSMPWVKNTSNNKIIIFKKCSGTLWPGECGIAQQRQWDTMWVCHMFRQVYYHNSLISWWISIGFLIKLLNTCWWPNAGLINSSHPILPYNYTNNFANLIKATKH